MRIDFAHISEYSETDITILIITIRTTDVVWIQWATLTQIIWYSVSIIAFCQSSSYHTMFYITETRMHILFSFRRIQ